MFAKPFKSGIGNRDTRFFGVDGSIWKICRFSQICRQLQQSEEKKTNVRRGELTGIGKDVEKRRFPNVWEAFDDSKIRYS